jgi:hypothetical protein
LIYLNICRTQFYPFHFPITSYYKFIFFIWAFYDQQENKNLKDIRFMNSLIYILLKSTILTNVGFNSHFMYFNICCTQFYPFHFFITSYYKFIFFFLLKKENKNNKNENNVKFQNKSLIEWVSVCYENACQIIKRGWWLSF